MAEKHSPISPKSVFLHVLMIAMLYATMIAAITMLFQYVNLLYPDKLVEFYGYSRSSLYNSLNWASSVLIIAFPVLVWSSWMLEKEFKKYPADRHGLVRRWLLYLTQFVTSITIIIDLMTLVYTYYSGDVSLRFLLKVGAVLLVAAVVLGYYYWDLRRESETSRVPMIVAVVSAVLIIAALVGGYFIGASPQSQRAVRFDEQRVSALSNIQSQVVSYYTTKKMVPEKLSDMENAISGFTVPVDPETNQAFEYTKKSDLSFELCATFGAESVDFEKRSASVDAKVSTTIGGSEAVKADAMLYEYSYPGDPYGKNWLHKAGRYCYSRDLDPDYFKTVRTTQDVSASIEPAVQ